MTNIERCKELIKEEHECWIGITNQLAIKELLEELEKQEEIINEMSECFGVIMTDIPTIKKQFEEKYCDFINSNEDCCWKIDTKCSDCIKEYFKKKREKSNE